MAALTGFAVKRTTVNFVKPLTAAQQRTSLEFFNVLNNLLQFAPTHPSEVAFRTRVTRIGIREGNVIDFGKLSSEMRSAIEQGVADAWVDIDATAKKLDTGEITPGDCYGTRAAVSRKRSPPSQTVLVAHDVQPKRLLVANPIDRYRLNTPMQPNWVKDADGGYTFYIQNASPGKDRESNWLPAPRGPFYMVMRLYLPSKEAQDGTWKAPRPRRTQ